MPSTGKCGLARVPPPAPQHPLENPPCSRSHFDLSSDLALNEAIRRSIEDQKEKVSIETEASESLVNGENIVTLPATAEVVQVETVEESDPDYKEATNSAQLIPEDVHATTEEICPSDKLQPGWIKLTDLISGKPYYYCESSGETHWDPPTGPPSVDANEAVDIAPAIYHATEGKTKTDQTDSHGMLPLARTEQDVVVPSAPVEPLVEPSNGSPQRFSYISNDEGETAVILGATLDRMAEAIDELKWDLEQADASARPGGLDDHEESKGAKIVDGDEDSEDDDDDDSESRDSWSVVTEEDKIAKATQALGSALFNSEVQNMSTLSNSNDTAHSSVTGLSTLATVPSVVQSVQLNRWFAQLEQLHELGFTNDELNVSILETLSAANIGVDSDDEVTVEQVVNQLIK